MTTPVSRRIFGDQLCQALDPRIYWGQYALPSQQSSHRANLHDAYQGFGGCRAHNMHEEEQYAQPMKKMTYRYRTSIGFLAAVCAACCAGAESPDNTVRIRLDKSAIEFHVVRVEDGGVYVDLADTSVADLSPLSGLPITGLNLADCRNVTNLTPLARMPLTFLNITGTAVTDLAPLREMPLLNFFFSPETATNNVATVRQSKTCININQGSPESFWREYDSPAVSRLRQLGLAYESVDVDTNGLWHLSFWKEDIRDLSPLQGLPLVSLSLSDTDVEDISPLRGMALEDLDLTNTRVRDLRPLEGMPLRSLFLQNCSNVVSIASLAGAPLRMLHLTGTRVKDISVLRGMPLGNLMLGRTDVTDVSPLKGMPLGMLGISPRRVTNALEIVAAMPTNAMVSIDHDFWGWYMSPSDFCDKVRHGDFTRPTIKPPNALAPVVISTADVARIRATHTNACAVSLNGRYGILRSESQQTSEYAESHTRYALADYAVNTNLWEREVHHAGDVLVEDDGWTWIVYTDEHIAGIGPDGREYGQARISWRSVFPERHIIQTSHGSYWARRYSHSFFFTFNDRLYYCIAPWWQQYILVDLYAGEHVPATGAILEPIERELNDFACRTLRDAIDRRDVIEASKYISAELNPVRAAVVIAGNRRIREAIPFLRQLEEFEFVDTEGIHLRGMQYDFADGDIDPFTSQEMKFRALVQLVLRRLGVAPACLPVFRFKREGASGADHWYEPPRLTAPRATRVHLVRPGIGVLDVLKTVGTPDFIGDYPRPHWDYDIDDEEPYTFRVFWPSGPEDQAGKLVVTGTERITPAVWQNSDSREMSIVD